MPAHTATALKPFILLWQNFKWQKFPFAKMEKMPFDMDFFLLLDIGISNGKSVSIKISKKGHILQMDTFCLFKFCHNRRNGLNLISSVLGHYS